MEITTTTTSTTTTTTTSTTTTTTTTTPPYLQGVSLLLNGRDSINNDPVANALVNVTLIMPGGARIPVATNIALNSKGKEGVLDLPANGNYQIDMKQTGFIDKTVIITVNATMDNEQIERVGC